MAAANWRKKVLKTEPDAVEQSVAQALHDLEKSVDPQHRGEIRDLTFHSASEVDAGAGKKSVLVVVPYTQLNNYRRLHHILSTNLEKKFRLTILDCCRVKKKVDIDDFYFSLFCIIVVASMSSLLDSDEFFPRRGATTECSTNAALVAAH